MNTIKAFAVDKALICSWFTKCLSLLRQSCEVFWICHRFFIDRGTPWATAVDLRAGKTLQWIIKLSYVTHTPLTSFRGSFVTGYLLMYSQWKNIEDSWNVFQYEC